MRRAQLNSREYLRSVASPLLGLLLVLLLTGCASQQAAKSQSKQYSFWPPAPDTPRVQFLISFSSSSDVAKARSKFDEMVYGKSTEQFVNKPYGLAIWNGRIYVTDLRSMGVAVFDLKQHETRMMGYNGAGQVQRPIDVAVSPEGWKYVIDASKNTILAFDADERFMSAISLPDFNPVAVTVYGSELYVSDMKGACVKVIDRASGRLLRTIGGPGPGDGQFVAPLSLRIDNQGNLLVADVLRCRVQKFTRDGKLLMAFGESGDRPGDFVRPKHMGIDKDGFIYVVDAAFDNVQVFDPNGKIAGFFGSYGTHPGAMNLPAGLAISEDPADLALFQSYAHAAFEVSRIVLITNQFGPAKISVYGMGKLKAGKTMADISSGRTDTNLGIQTGAKPTTGPIDMGSPLPPELLAPPTSAPAATN